ncbi:type II toxin-antitoxin system RelE/ParE family toxin [Desulfonema magnum]|uniref:Toxin-antitoxin system, toxin component HigB domain-containing n=1 Tax=Desulfonema magnum TaxID=45655 RepID=A0A975GLL5_9BACT|nr:type II toxin-antitoxin system RelE/ParE family toxin [Desulfonema magnum]QTA85710.1 Toxin-antitoxin system, toxin component HigB domain-containing [Desulfonema magnum]
MKTDEEKIKGQQLRIKFYQNDLGKEPVKDWLKTLQKDARKAVGKDMMTVQYGWPIGMPVVRALSGYKKLWEVRTELKGGIARIMFTIYKDVIVLLHGIIKKSQKTPKKDIDIAEKRKKSFLKNQKN